MIRVDELPPPRPGSVFPPGWHETVGSSGAGKAMNLARLGVDVVLHCQLGEDEAGRRVRERLEDAGVTVDAILDRTGTARHVNLMSADGERLSFLLHTGDREARYDADRVERLVDDADHVMVAIVDPARDVIPIARRLGKPIWTDLHDALKQTDYIRDFLAADYVFFSEAGASEPRAFMAELSDAGRELVVCTRGAAGAIARTRDRRWLDVPAEPVQVVVDTNGAGDAFLSGVAFGVLAGAPIERSLAIGARVASLAVQSPELASADLSPNSVADLP
jgi:sugar/nucleoside kinase (ribokinase family)